MSLKWANPKDPDDILDYAVDWSARLDTGDTIVTSTFVVVDGTVEIGDTSIVGGKTIVWLSAGTDGETCNIRNRIVTGGGRQMDMTVQLKVKTR